jgi:hypothetical protein
MAANSLIACLDLAPGLEAAGAAADGLGCPWRYGDIAAASRRFLAARSEFERARRIVTGWTRACGHGVWRQGHPSDAKKLWRLKQASLTLRCERRLLLQAFAAAEPVGVA